MFKNLIMFDAENCADAVAFVRKRLHKMVMIMPGTKNNSLVGRAYIVVLQGLVRSDKPCYESAWILLDGIVQIGVRILLYRAIASDLENPYLSKKRGKIRTGLHHVLCIHD